MYCCDAIEVVMLREQLAMRMYTLRQAQVGVAAPSVSFRGPLSE